MCTVTPSAKIEKANVVYLFIELCSFCTEIRSRVTTSYFGVQIP